MSDKAEMSVDAAIALVEQAFPGTDWSVSNYSRQRGIEGCTAILGDTSYGSDPELIATASTPALALLALIGRGEV